MFHKSLSEVPAGLTPIRTRSDDFEAELADFRGRTAPSAQVPKMSCNNIQKIQADARSDDFETELADLRDGGAAAAILPESLQAHESACLEVETLTL